MNDDPSAELPRHFNGFIPLTLIALSFIIILGWELFIANQARTNGQRLREQQSKMVDQSKQIQTGLEKLARDLIDVARDDNDAQALVSKYNINISAPAPAPVPAASPAATASP